MSERWSVEITSSGAEYPTEVWTNFGPLTTAFTPPAKCVADKANDGLVEFTIASGSSSLTSYDCGQANPYYIQDPDCYPNHEGVAVFQTIPVSSLFGAYWSPGLVCPSGWETGATYSYAAPASSSVGVVWNSVIGDSNQPATFASCCPGGFMINTDGRCAYQVTTATSGAMCDLNFKCGVSNSTSASSVCPSNASAFTWDPSQTDTSISIIAYGMLLVYQPTDLSLTQVPTTQVQTITVIPTNPKTPDTASSGSGTGNQSPQHLSSGTPASVLIPAIVVPVVALFAIIGLIIFLLRRRKQKARSSAYAPSSRNGPFQYDKANTTTASVTSDDYSFAGDRAEHNFNMQ